MGCGTSNDVRDFKQIDQHIWRGKLVVQLKSATIKKELQIFGKQDPYVKLRFGRQEQQSDVCEDGGMFPVWNTKHDENQFTFDRTNEEDTVYIQVWNKNLITADDFIGEGGFSLTKVRKGKEAGKVDQTCCLYGKGKDIGEIKFVISFELLPECLDNSEVKAIDTIGKVIIKPKKATLQRDTNWVFGTMSPICIVRLGSDSLSTAANMEGGKNPKWLDELIFTRDELQRDTFQIEVQNFDDSGDSELIGTGFLSFSPFLIQNKTVIKTVELFYEGVVAGNIEIHGEYVSDEPEKLNSNQQDSYQQKQHEGESHQQQQQNIQQQINAIPTNGEQEYRYPNGDFYSGQWANGCRHGSGKCIYRIGMEYDGQWLNDLWHGQGTLRQSGTLYIGQFANGKKNGHGKLNWEGKQQCYEGEWMDNNYHGEGFWTFENGQKRQGYFQNGTRSKWLDVKEVQNFLPCGRVLTQGGTLPSDDGHYVLNLAYNGHITIIDTHTRFISYAISQFNRPIRPPFFLRLENHGVMNVLDATGLPYYTSGNVNGQPMFKLVMQNDGKIGIHDANGVVWLSH